MKIIIAGYGFVGKAVANALKDQHEIIIQDPQYTDYKIMDHLDADGIIVCVPTPTTEYGVCDASIIADILDNVPIFMPVLIKSTVTPGIAEGFKEIYPEHSICYSPEFLRASSADGDFLNQRYAIIGGEDPEYFWHELFQTTLPKCKIIHHCTEEEACLVKYTTNSFLALKTSFFNQIYDICEKTGMNFDVVRQLISQDARIGPDHTMVPGPDGYRGWGGHCFPKDTHAFIKWTNTIGAPSSLVESAVEYNKNTRNKP